MLSVYRIACYKKKLNYLLFSLGRDNLVERFKVNATQQQKDFRAHNFTIPVSEGHKESPICAQLYDSRITRRSSFLFTHIFCDFMRQTLRRILNINLEIARRTKYIPLSPRWKLYL